MQLALRLPGSFGAVIRRGLDVWVPKELMSDLETLRRARLVVNLASAVIFVSGLMLGKYSFDGATEICWRVALSLALQPLSLVVLRTTGSYRAAGHLFCAMLWFLFFNIATLSGGISAPNLVSNTFIVIAAAMLCGPRSGVVWLAVVVATYVSQFVLSAKGIFVHQTLAPENVQEIRLAELIATAVASTAAAYLYETGKQRMLVALEREKVQVEEAHRDIRVFLDSTGQGFLSLDGDGRLVGQHSAIAERWLGKPKLGQPFEDFLARHCRRFAGAFQIGWSAMKEGALPLEVIVDQLPKRLTVGRMSLSFEYRPMTARTGEVEATVVIVSDITAEVASEKAAVRQRDLFRMFNQIVNDGEGFRRFVEEASEMVDAIVAGKLRGSDLRRAIHTLKGNAGAMEMAGLGAACHRAEGELEEGRVNSGSLQALADELRQAQDLLGQFSFARDPDAITLTPAEYRSFLSRLTTTSAAQLEAEVQLWRLQPLSRDLEQVATQARALSMRLGKGSVDVAVEDNGVRIAPTESWRAFSMSLVHAVRNAVDHGLESPDERYRVGKASGCLLLRSTLTERDLIVEVADDGRGIDWERVRERAAGRGLPTTTQDELVEAIFADGISTRDVASEVSGRGIGMGAVREACCALGGTVELRSVVGKGTSIRFVFPRTRLQVGAGARPSRLVVERPAMPSLSPN